MLLLGSAGRNSGKTEFACAVLRKLAADRPIVGIKVTAIRKKDGSCPRGGKGCGVCSSLTGEYCIDEETNADSTKDTSRLLAAGADRVFWLRVMTAHLSSGIAALMDMIGPDAICVCESNSLRKAVKPGLFLMVRDRHSRRYKESARAVSDNADRTVLSDGKSFDIDFADIRFANGKWILREHATAIVLAGGASQRMNRDKSMLQVKGRPMIEHVCNQLRDHFDEILVSANDKAKYKFLGLEVVPDRNPGFGPMMGVSSALAVSSHDLNLAVACDIPEVDMTLAHRMLAYAEGRDAVVPRVDGALLEPLFAVYRKSAAAKMDELLREGERRIRRLFGHCRTRFVDLKDPGHISNLNTMKEYLAYVSKRDPALR